MLRWVVAGILGVGIGLLVDDPFILTIATVIATDKVDGLLDGFVDAIQAGDSPQARRHLAVPPVHRVGEAESPPRPAPSWRFLFLCRVVGVAASEAPHSLKREVSLQFHPQDREVFPISNGNVPEIGVRHNVYRQSGFHQALA